MGDLKFFPKDHGFEGPVIQPDDRGLLIDAECDALDWDMQWEAGFVIDGEWVSKLWVSEDRVSVLSDRLGYWMDPYAHHQFLDKDEVARFREVLLSLKSRDGDDRWLAAYAETFVELCDQCLSDPNVSGIQFEGP